LEERAAAEAKKLREKTRRERLRQIQRKIEEEEENKKERYRMERSEQLQPLRENEEPGRLEEGKRETEQEEVRKNLRKAEEDEERERYDNEISARLRRVQAREEVRAILEEEERKAGGRHRLQRLEEEEYDAMEHGKIRTAHNYERLEKLQRKIEEVERLLKVDSDDQAWYTPAFGGRKVEDSAREQAATEEETGDMIKKHRSPERSRALFHETTDYSIRSATQEVNHLKSLRAMRDPNLSLSIKGTISEDCTGIHGNERTSKLQCLRKEAQRHEQPHVDHLAKASSSPSTIERRRRR
jgi:hypothetical protein